MLPTCLPSFPEKTEKVSSLVELLSYRGQNQAAQTAYTFIRRGNQEVAQLTYQDLDQKARAIAAELQSVGAEGKSALLLYSPSLEFIAGFFGCLYASVLAVPVYPPRPNQKLNRLQAIVQDAQATLVLTTTDLRSSIERQLALTPDLAQMEWITTDNLDISFASDWQPPSITPDNLAFLQYTSGSTGNPKGVMVSHSNLMNNLDLIYQAFGHHAQSRGVIWLPPYHDMGLIGGILQPLYGGFPVYLMSPTDFLQKPLRWLQAISHYRATTSGGPNFAYDLVCRKVKPEQLEQLDLSCWQVAFSGAETVRETTLNEMVKTFADCGFRREAFYPCYGMAETTLIVSGGTVEAVPKVQSFKASSLQKNQVELAKEATDSCQLVSCGQSLGNHQIKIVDPQSLTTLKDDQIGEIWLKGASIARGYWNRPKHDTFNAYLKDTGEGLFLRTGDLGFLHEGELFITGRIKDVIIIGGRNYHPQDIELTVQNSHPALRPNAGAAFSIEGKSSEELVIIQEVQRSYLRHLNVKEIIDSIRQALTAEYSLQLHAIVLVKPYSIPTTSSGKIRRFACREHFLNGTLNVVEDWSANPRNKAKYLHLKAEVESVLTQLQTVNSVSDSQDHNRIRH